MTTRKWLLLAAMIVAGIVAYLAWDYFQPRPLPEGFASSNGRIEATDIDVATKLAGRLISVQVKEGDFVEAGQILAQMDTAVLQAQLKQAEAELRRARNSVETAHSIVKQRQSEKDD